VDVRRGFFINGEFIPRAASGRSLELISPSTEEVSFQVPEAGDSEIDSAVAAARRAFDEGPWPRMTTKERAEVITAACDALESKIEAAAQIQADEMGGPVTLGRMTARSAIDVVRAMAAEVVGYDEIDARTKAELAELAREVLERPVPEPAGAWTDMWSDGSGQWRN